MVRVDPYNLNASSFGGGLGNSPANQRERLHLQFSGILVTSVGVKDLLMAASLGSVSGSKQFEIWGFHLDCSGAQAINAIFEDQNGNDLFPAYSALTGGSKTIFLPMPMTPGPGGSIKLNVSSIPALSSTFAGVFYTIIDTD
jgi:hypothetical protein